VSIEEHRLHQQTVLPLAALTQFEVGRIALRGMEASVTQDYHLCFALSNPPLKGVIRDMRAGTRPRHDQPPLIQQETEFPPDNPAMIGETFATNLPGAAAFSDRVDQLNPIRVDNPEHRWGSQEGRRPYLMRHEEAKEPRPLGELGKQRAIVARQPVLERAVATALEGMQNPQGHNFTRPQGGVGMFEEAWEMVIDLAE
jgi:hypothetical protein